MPSGRKEEKAKLCFVGEKDLDFLYLDMGIRYLGEDLLLQRLIERKGTQMIAKKAMPGRP